MYAKILSSPITTAYIGIYLPNSHILSTRKTLDRTQYWLTSHKLQNLPLNPPNFTSTTTQKRKKTDSLPPRDVSRPQKKFDMSSQFNPFQTLLGSSTAKVFLSVKPILSLPLSTHDGIHPSSHLVTLPPSLPPSSASIKQTQLIHHPSNQPKSKTRHATPRLATPRLTSKRRYHRNPNPHTPAPAFSSNNLEPQPQQQQQRHQQSFHIASHRIARILELSTVVKSALPDRQKGCLQRVACC